MPTTTTTPTRRQTAKNLAGGNLCFSDSVDSEESGVDDILEGAVPIIKDRLYFVTCSRKPASTPDLHFFTIDNVFVYIGYNMDFGPLNLAMVTKYCRKINRKLKLVTLANKKLIHVTSFDVHKRVNAAFLAAAYGVLYLGMTPDAAFHLVASESRRRRFRDGVGKAFREDTETAVSLRDVFVHFRDACVAQTSTYDLSLLDTLKGLKRGVDCGFYDPETFDVPEYEARERVENGDTNWIIPGKMLAFCGPHPRARVDERGYPYHSPESYFDYFRQHKVKSVIRLNAPTYDGRRFSSAGFSHRDLYFPDGSTPNQQIVDKFLRICETTEGAIAVHCKAGLGRTGSLIGCYLNKHHKFSAAEAIAWLRICRPGSVIGLQQNWLVQRCEKEVAVGRGEEAVLYGDIFDACEAQLAKEEKVASAVKKDVGPSAVRTSARRSLPTTGDSQSNERLNLVKENLVIGVLNRENMVNESRANRNCKKSSRGANSKERPGPRRNCWIEDDVLATASAKKGEVEKEADGEEELSQGDLLNRRKLAVKQNVLVETVKRGTTSSARKAYFVSSAPAKMTTTTTDKGRTPEATTPTSSRRTSGRLHVQTSKNSVAVTEKGNARNSNSPSSSQNLSHKASSTQNSKSIHVSTVSSSAPPSPNLNKTATSSAPTSTYSPPSTRVFPAAASKSPVLSSHTSTNSSLSFTSAQRHLSSPKSDSSGGGITANSPLKTQSAPITRSASRKSGIGTPSSTTTSPPLSRTTPPPARTAKTPPPARTATSPSSSLATTQPSLRPRGNGAGYISGKRLSLLHNSSHCRNSNNNNDSSYSDSRDDNISGQLDS